VPTSPYPKLKPKPVPDTRKSISGMVISRIHPDLIVGAILILLAPLGIWKLVELLVHVK
jgi:hypothetical protein